MMSIKISLQDLQTLSESLVAHEDDLALPLEGFLAEPKEDYYFYGREPITAAEYLKVAITNIEKMISYPEIKENHALYDTLNVVYQAGITTRQQSVFLYGRNRV